MPASDPSAWVVHKFGGSSVADAECFKRVANILETLPPGRLGVVLSACRGVTDALLGLVTRAEAQDDTWRGDLDAVRARHNTIAESLLSPDARQLYMAGFDRDRHDIEGILHTVKLTRSASNSVRDLIAGYGEIWSTKLFREFFAARKVRPGEVKWIDARQAVVVQWGPLGPAVQWDVSRAKLRALVGPSSKDEDFKGTLIITGFIASNAQGVQTTLGRNGSDFSGSIFGSLLDASEIHIWTDVDGVLSADPRRVPDAKVIDALSYNEAMELAYFGAKVIHPQTMAPAVGRGIPIWIRNTFAPQKQGSLISAKPQSKLPVKGITSIENIAMVNVEGAGMIGVPGTAHRLFGALREEGISVILISQGSSEHSICCAIPGVHVEALRRLGISVAGVLGSSADKSRHTASVLGLPRGYGTFDELLADANVRAVHITSPNRHHFEQCKQAIAAGKHVICEKPLAMTSAETLQLVEIAAKSAVVTAVCYNVRYYPLCLEARERIHGGQLGNIHHITGSYVQDWLLHDTDFNWRVLAEDGGSLRAVADIGTHWLDLVQSITGLKVVRVSAVLQTVHPVRRRPRGPVETFQSKLGTEQNLVDIPITTDDFGAVLLQFDNGATGSFHVSQATAGRKNCIRFEIAGAKSALAWDSERPNELWQGHRDRANELLIRDPALLHPAVRPFANYPGGHNEGFPDTFKQLFRAVYDAIERGNPRAPRPFPTFADGHREVLLCEAIQQSHREQRWVDV